MCHRCLLFQKKDDLISSHADRESITTIRINIRTRVKYFKNKPFKQEAKTLKRLKIQQSIEKLRDSLLRQKISKQR